MKRLPLTIVILLVLLVTAIPAVGAPLNAPRVKVKDGTSTNWAGYAVETNLNAPQSNAVTDVVGQWVVPAVQCTSTNTYSSAWVGIDGYSDNTVEQIGTEQDCSNGQASYYAWFEMYPKWPYRINMAVRPGDSISAEVKYVARNQFGLSMTNITTGQSFATTQKGRAQLSSAEWIIEAPWSGGVLPLSNFGTITFTNAKATLNGHTGTISDSAWQNDRMDMVNNSGALKAQTSNLSSGGSSFSDTWISSQ